jgi:putative endonuclease
MNSSRALKRLLPSLVGAQFEKNTESYLNKNGLRTICRNYRCRSGEIDLVMDDGEYIIFVEVRFRRSDNYGSPFESITASKQKRIIRAATHFLSTKARFQDRPCRFDAVGVSQGTRQVKYDWIKDAFST